MTTSKQAGFSTVIIFPEQTFRLISKPFVSQFRTLSRSGLLRVLLGASFLVATTACSFSNKANSPEVLYSKKSSEAQALQIPPDLTDISDGEQFVLPGDSGAPVRRNTLLPGFANVELQREGEQSWLDIKLSPEEVWPRLLAFSRRENFEIAQTEPVNGLVFTAWQASDKKGSIFKNLVGGETERYQRAAFRLERGALQSTRLFVRVQQASKELATASGSDLQQWPAKTHNLEQTSEILQRFLVFLGLDEQRAKGLLNDQSAAAIIDDAAVKNTAGGTQLVLHHGYRQSFDLLQQALTGLGFTIENNDSSTGEIFVVESTSQTENQTGQFTLKVEPVHISEVNVSAFNRSGRPLDASKTRSLMSQLREILA